MIPIEQVLGSAATIASSRVEGEGPEGRLPLTAEMLRHEPSGNIFGLTQNVGMGWRPDALGGAQYVIVSTMGGVRSDLGEPIALGYHTGHWEIGLLVRGAADALRANGAMPFAVYCSDPCDGRTQGTTGMFDSLAYRNDAAIVMRRLIRSLPTASGVLGIASCDKGLPATMLALAGVKTLPGVVVPGGVTLPARGAEDAGQVQSLGARFTHDLISLDYAATMGCRACGSSGGGCQFLGTAATSQVVAEALGLALPHSALAPSGEPVWLELASRSASALQRLHQLGLSIDRILTAEAIENAMLLHAAFGGSTNLLLHIPAIAAAAGLTPPRVEDWIRINRATPRLVDALPNGPRGFATAQVFMAGGVPEVMLHLRRAGLLNGGVMTATGDTLDATLDWWESSERRQAARARLAAASAIDPDQVIMAPDAARRSGLTSTVVFPRGNLAPQGSVIKATALDASVIDADGVYRHRGPARVFTDERDAIAAVKGGVGEAGPRGRRDRPHRHGAIGHRHAGDGPDHHGAPLPAMGQARGARHRRPFLGPVHRRVRRSRRPRGAGRRTDRAGARRRPDRDRGRPEHADRHGEPCRRGGRAARCCRLRRAAPRAVSASGPRSARATARRQPALGGAAARQRRHVEWMHLRRRSDRGGTRRRGRREAGA